MGSVAWDGKKLVTTDRGLHGNAINPGTDQFLYTPEEGKDYWEVYGVKVLAFAIGTTTSAAPFIKERLEQNLTHHNAPMELPTGAGQTGVLLVDENGLCWLWITDTNNRETTAELTPINGPYAAGPGESIMFGVLSIGKCAETAIKIAINLDCNTVGNPVVWEFPGKPETPSTRPAHLVIKKEETK